MALGGFDEVNRRRIDNDCWMLARFNKNGCKVILCTKSRCPTLRFL